FVHRGGSPVAQAATERAGRAAARLRQLLANAGRASNLVAATCVLVVPATVHDRDHGVLCASYLAAERDILDVRARAGGGRALFARSLWVCVLAEPARGTPEPRAAARGAAHASLEPWR